MFDIFGNGTTAPPVNWQPDASTRGTTDILSTCLITLGICLWSALHLNIPRYGKSSQQKWYKCGWLLVGLFAPEMVAYTAWAQLRAARRLDNEMRQLLGEAPSSSLRDKFWRLLRAERNGQCTSTSGRDSVGNYTEQHNESQTDEEDVGLRQFNIARGDQPPGIASYKTWPEGNHYPANVDPKLDPFDIAVAANRCHLVDVNRDNERCASCGSEIRHRMKIDEADTELREDYGCPSHRQPESAEPTTLPYGKRSIKKRRYPWTMTHSFYAIMGGFAFDTSDAQPNFLPNHRSRLCISVNGLAYIADKAPGLIPDIAEGQIKDKSKADNLAKFLVCLQALWFCVQCITRVTQRKAIGLLELNTFAHAFCALLIYALWWHKPQDIEEPTLLQGQKEWAMCAFLCMNCTINSEQNEVSGGSVYGQPEYDGPRRPIWIYWDEVAASDRMPNPRTNGVYREGIPYPRNPLGEEPAIMLKHGESIYGFRCKQLNADRISGQSSRTLKIEPPHLRRLELYLNATRIFKTGRGRFPYDRAVCDSMPHWPLTLFLKESDLLRMGYRRDNINSVLLGLIVSGLLYGGLHLLAWEMPFTSRAECILWRFSGIFIISTGLGFTGLTGLLKAHGVFKSDFHVGKISDRLSTVFSTATLFLLCLGYLLARTFLVVECFLQLSRLPASAYETPAWSVYFPHIT